MMSALEGGCIIGSWLAKSCMPSSLSSHPHNPFPSPQGIDKAPQSDMAANEVEKYYGFLRDQYEQSRKYYYGIVHRFGDEGQEFWAVDKV
jgi:hypothetical protein